MERHSRRSALLHLTAVALLFLGYGLELLGRLLDLVQSKRIVGSLSVTLAPVVVEAEGHAKGHAAVHAVGMMVMR
jgi:hypothetical protein